MAIEYTPNGGTKLHTETKDLKKAVVNTVVSVGVGKLTKGSGDEALKKADQKVVEANNKVSTAERRLVKSPSSTTKATQLKNAQSSAQLARSSQVRTKMLNSTIGKVNEKAVQQAVGTTNNRIQKVNEK